MNTSRTPCQRRPRGERAARIVRRWLPGLVLAACAATASAQAPPGDIRLRLLDGVSGAPLAGSAVAIEVYVHQTGCSQDSCFGYHVDVKADGDGVVVLPSSSPEAAGRPITELRVSAAGHAEKRVGPKALASAQPVTVRLPLGPPALADLRLRLVDAKTHVPLAGVPVHFEIVIQRVVCVMAPCLVPRASLDLTADAQGEVVFAQVDRAKLPPGYMSMTITAGRYPPIDVAPQEFAVPQPVTLQMGRDAPSPPAPRAPRMPPAPPVSPAVQPAEPPHGLIRAAIRTADGHYLTVVNGGGLAFARGRFLCAFYTDATVARGNETLTVEWLDRDYKRFTLKTRKGYYVSAINGGGVGGPNDATSTVHTDASTIGIWEALALNFLPGGDVTIGTLDGHFLAAFDGGGIKGQTCPVMSTLATEAGTAETFTLADVPDSVVRRAPPHTLLPQPPPPPVQPRQAPPPTPVDPDPVVQKLNDDTHVRWIHMGTGMLSPVELPPPVLDPRSISRATVQAAALAFLTRYGGIWHIADPAHELRESRYTAGDETVIVFDQWNGGVPVFDTVVLLSFDDAGRLTLVNSGFVRGLDSIPKKPQKSASEVRTILLNAAGACEGLSASQCESSLSTPVLGISFWDGEGGGHPRLVYRATAGSRAIVVDANTGEVLANYSTLQSAAPIPTFRPQSADPQQKPYGR